MRTAIRVLLVLAGMTALVPARAADTQELGRLFFTPERRATLEHQRAFNAQEAQTLQATTTSLDGVV